jgi:hypothetical protein
MSDERFLVPRHGLAWDDIEQAMADLGAQEDEPQDGDLFAWTLGRSSVRMYEDGALHVNQIVVDGSDSDDVAERIRHRLPTYSPADMPELFAAVENDDDLDDALAILALVAPAQADPQLIELFRRGLAHDDWIIRQAALIALSVTAWPELRGDVQRLARDDRHDEVRKLAASVLKTIDDHA